MADCEAGGRDRQRVQPDRFLGEMMNEEIFVWSREGKVMQFFLRTVVVRGGTASYLGRALALLHVKSLHERETLLSSSVLK